MMLATTLRIKHVDVNLKRILPSAKSICSLADKTFGRAIIRRNEKWTVMTDDAKNAADLTEISKGKFVHNQAQKYCQRR